MPVAQEIVRVRCTFGLRNRIMAIEIHRIRVARNVGPQDLGVAGNG